MTEITNNRCAICNATNDMNIANHQEDYRPNRSFLTDPNDGFTTICSICLDTEDDPSIILSDDDIDILQRSVY